MGGYSSDADSHPDANTYSDRHAVSHSEREPGRFGIADRFSGRVAGADVCVPARVAEREQLSDRDAFAEGKCHVISVAKGDRVRISDRDPLAKGEVEGVAVVDETPERVISWCVRLPRPPRPLQLTQGRVARHSAVVILQS